MEAQRDRWGETLKYDDNGMRLFQIYQRDHFWLDTIMTFITFPLFLVNAACLPWECSRDPTYDPTVWRPRGVARRQ